MPRENAHSKANRLLVSGAVTVTFVDHHRADARVVGDHDVYTATITPNRRTCTCPSWRPCSHLAALARVVHKPKEGTDDRENP